MCRGEKMKNETTKKDTKKDVLNTEYVFIDKKQHKYISDDKHIITDVYNDVRSDYKITDNNNNKNINVRFMKPQIDFKSLIDFQNKDVETFKKHLNVVMDTLNKYENKTLLKETFLKINSKSDLENTIYMLFCVENDHKIETKTETTQENFKTMFKSICEKYESEKNKRSFDNFYSALNIHLNEKLENNQDLKENLLSAIKTKYEKPQITHSFSLDF